MRTRTRTVYSAEGYYSGSSTSDIYKYHTQSGDDLLYQHPGPPAMASALGPLCRKTERIDDESGYDKVNHCSHRKYQYLLNSNPLVNYGYGEISQSDPMITYRTGTSGYMPLLHRQYFDQILDDMYNQYIPDVEGLKQAIPDCTFNYNTAIESKLYLDCLQKANATVSDWLLDLVEAEQTMAMWSGIRKTAKTLASLKRNWGSIRKVLKSASGTWLMSRYGVNPLIADMGDVYNGMQKLRNNIDRKVNGSDLRVSSSSRISPTCLAKSGLHPDYPSWHYSSTPKFGLPPEIRYVMCVRPKMAYYSAFMAKADAILSSFATSPADLAWETMRWSFVVDWFLDVRAALHAVDQALGVLPYDVVYASRSMTYQLLYDFEFRMADSWGISPQKFIDRSIGTIEVSHYERRPALPPSLWPEWQSRFGKNQAADSVALITQKFLK